MTFYEAMQAVADGKTAKRHAWVKQYISLQCGCVWSFWRGALFEEYKIVIRDLTATDWEIVE